MLSNTEVKPELGKKKALFSPPGLKWKLKPYTSRVAYLSICRYISYVKRTFWDPPHQIWVDSRKFMQSWKKCFLKFSPLFKCPKRWKNVHEMMSFTNHLGWFWSTNVDQIVENIIIYIISWFNFILYFFHLYIFTELSNGS